jgi:nitroreductase / dihydropteridine reductase
MLLDKLNWRYATKKFDPSRVVPQDKIDRIVEAVRLAPTSSGLQPYEVLVITNAELKAKVLPIASGQGQVVDCSHLLVFAAWDTYTADRINQAFDLVVEERRLQGPGLENWNAYRQRLLGAYVPRDARTNFEHAARQAYIGFGIAIAAAALEEVDATPMEGFDAAALDDLLGLGPRGLKSVTILPLGYRQSDQDWLVGLKKVRRDHAQFVSEIR